MKKYSFPAMEIERFLANDIVTASEGGDSPDKSLKPASIAAGRKVLSSDVKSYEILFE